MASAKRTLCLAKFVLALAVPFVAHSSEYMHKCAYMSTLCFRTQLACLPRSTGITPGFCVCECPSYEALGYTGDPQWRQRRP